MRRRVPLPLLLALAGAWLGTVGAERHPGLAAAAGATLLFTPGWGLLRCLSSVDRRFGVAGASLVLSLLLLGAVPRLLPNGTALAATGPGLHVLAVALCLVGGGRLRRHDRRQAALPPHPAPMPLSPGDAGACVLVALLALVAVAVASPLGAPPDAPGAETLTRATEALARLQDRPVWLGEPVPERGLFAPAAATLGAATALHPLHAVGLLGLAALLALLLLSAECCSRLWGNQGAAAAMLVVLLGLHPAAALDERLGAAAAPGGLLAPFVAHQESAAALACLALLLSSTLSVLRRASHHVPRLVGAAACGLVLALPAATWLWLPGWVLGALLAHLACRGSPDNDADRTNPWRRPGDPRVLRAPFWRLVLPLGAGVALGALLLEPGAASGARWAPSGQRLALALLAWAPAALLTLPGVRALHAAPGREAFFYVGLLGWGVPALALFALPEVPGALPTGVLLLWLPPAVAGGISVARLRARPQRLARLLPWLLLLLALPATLDTLARSLLAEHSLQLRDGRPHPVEVSSATAAAWQPLHEVARRAHAEALLVAGAALPAADPRWWRLAAGRTLAPVPGLGPAGADATAAATARLPSGRQWPLRIARGAGAAELWAVVEPRAEPWPGFEVVAAESRRRLLRARAPDVLLVTVAGLGWDDLAALPALVDAVGARGRVVELLAPATGTSAGLAALLDAGSLPTSQALPPAGHGARRDAPSGTPPAGFVHHLRRAGWRTVALLSLDPADAALAPHLRAFDVVEARPRHPLPARVERALDVLAAPAPEPRLLWWHADDLTLPLRAPDGAAGERPWPSPRYDPEAPHAVPPGPREVGRERRRRLLAELDLALVRLLSSLDADDLFLLTAPHGRQDAAAPLPYHAGLEPDPAADGPPGAAVLAALRVPLLLAGPEGRALGPPADGLPCAADVGLLLAGGDWPARDELVVLGTPRRGAATGDDPFDRSPDGPAERLAAAIRAEEVLLLTSPGGAPPAGWWLSRTRAVAPERVGGPEAVGPPDRRARLAALAARRDAESAGAAPALSPGGPAPSDR